MREGQLMRGEIGGGIERHCKKAGPSEGGGPDQAFLGDAISFDFVNFVLFGIRSFFLYIFDWYLKGDL